ncbi:MAG: right-handed parallel beta-helix repeat-containing protein [Clostridia bacterium]|nr:right-handed parallel beta-helix repeat-containing protein [Clostridia bacterium]
MKKFLSILLAVVFIMSTATIAFGADSSSEIYVSPDGNDSADGSFTSPLATLEGAKELAKTKDGSVTVYFREGVYTFTDTVNFTRGDKANVTYKSYNNEKVVFTAGTPYTGFEECTVNGVKAFKKNVGKDASISTLFNSEKTLKKTRYPETGYLYPQGVDGKNLLVPDWSGEISTFTSYVAMYVNKDEMPEMKNPNDIVVRILHWWKDEILPVKGYDSSTGLLEFTRRTNMRINKNDRFFLENVFAALNEPEEWYFDKSEGVLYYVPNEGESAENLTLWGGSLETLVKVSGVDSISFEGIVFRGNGYTLRAGGDMSSQAAYDAKPCLFYEDTHNFTVKNCEFKDLASCAVFMGSVVTDAKIENCIFSNIGAQAVYIRGENVPVESERVTKNITVTNNLISGYGKVFFNAVAVLVIHANSVDITHNEIHDGYYTAISVGWVWGYDYTVTYNNKICDNLIYNIGQGWLSDMGGIYTLGNQPNTVISGNVIHNVAADPDEGGYGGWGVYLDEGSSYILVENNLAYACGSDSYHLHYGSYNTVRNNIFALSGESQVRVVSSFKRSVANDGGRKTADFINNIILTNGKARTFSCHDDKRAYADENNIFWDATYGDELYTSSGTDAKKSFSLETAVRKGFVNSPIVADPCFKDALNFDFQLSESSPAIEAGFKPWDYQNAGTLKGTTIGLDTEGGQTAYNAESKAVEITPSKEKMHFFVNIINKIWKFLIKLFK